MSYSDSLRESLPEDLLKEDEEVARFPLNVKSVRIVDSNETFLGEKASKEAVK